MEPRTLDTESLLPLHRCVSDGVHDGADADNVPHAFFCREGVLRAVDGGA